MKIKITEVELSPDELHESAEIQKLLGSHERDAPIESEGGLSGLVSGADDLPKDVKHVLDKHASPAVRGLYERFVSGALDQPDTEARVSRSKTTKGEMAAFVRLHRLGAKASYARLIVRRRYATFRLPKEAAKGFRYAWARGEDNDRPFKVAVRITSEAHLKEALTLAKLAYERALKE